MTITLPFLRFTLASWICPEIVTERRNLERLANHDALTGLANRRAFELASKAAFAPGSEMQAILFDANNFGRINKVKGHETGDDYLRAIADALKSAANSFGLAERVFRLGGDEFVIIAPSRVALQIRDMAEASFGFHTIEDGESHFVVSISGTLGNTLEQADSTLQLRKQVAKLGK